jgi:microcystin-dependent protein
VGAGAGPGLAARFLGEKGGEETVSLTTGQLASHSHTDSGHAHQLESFNQGGAPTQEVGGSITASQFSGEGGANYTLATTTAGSFDVGYNAKIGTANITSTGAGEGHSNIQPFTACPGIIKH